jgi:hypothetical protein
MLQSRTKFKFADYRKRGTEDRDSLLFSSMYTVVYREAFDDARLQEVRLPIRSLRNMSCPKGSTPFK